MSSSADKYEDLKARIKAQPKMFSPSDQKYFYMLCADDFPELFSEGDAYRSKNRRGES